MQLPSLCKQCKPEHQTSHGILQRIKSFLNRVREYWLGSVSIYRQDKLWELFIGQFGNASWFCGISDDSLAIIQKQLEKTIAEERYFQLQVDHGYGVFQERVLTRHQVWLLHKAILAQHSNEGYPCVAR